MRVNKQGWLEAMPGFRMVPSPNFDSRPMCSISLVVVHNISLPPCNFSTEYIEDFFLNKLSYEQDLYFEQIRDMRVSAHCLIDRDGHIIQFVSFLDRAWHAGLSSYNGRERCNDYSIGIELVGADHVAYTGEQYGALAGLLGLLKCEFPEIGNNIVGHSDVAPGRKTDPGPAFDWKLLASLY